MGKVWRRVKAWLTENGYKEVTSGDLIKTARDRSNASLVTLEYVLNDLNRAEEELATAKDCDLRLIEELERNIERASQVQAQNGEIKNKIKEVVGG